jgi:hypothetical protein
VKCIVGRIILGSCVGWVWEIEFSIGECMGISLLIISNFDNVSHVFSRTATFSSSAMRASILVNLLYIGLAVTVLSAPIPFDVLGVSDMVRGLGFCTIVTVLSFGAAALSYCIEGAVNNHNNHKAIDYYFQKLRKWEAEKTEMGSRNSTQISLEDHDG